MARSVLLAFAGVRCAPLCAGNSGETSRRTQKPRKYLLMSTICKTYVLFWHMYS